jgi:hypothetical protein
MDKIDKMAKVFTNITRVPSGIDLRDIQYRIMVLRLDILILIENIRNTKEVYL